MWHTYTPDGRELHVRRERDIWIARCGKDEARSASLDVAMIEAIRADHTVEAHVRVERYADWIRAQADLIEGRLR
jgi:putative IMPACT (imprinted ancient) family translation regulator